MASAIRIDTRDHDKSPLHSYCLGVNSGIHVHSKLKSPSSTVPHKLHLHHACPPITGDRISYIASASSDSDRLYRVRIAITPSVRRGQHPPPDVLTHIRASTHDAVVPILHHYFGEAYGEEDSCTICLNGGNIGSQAPKFAIIIQAYCAYPTLADLLDTRHFLSFPALTVPVFLQLTDLLLFLNEQNISFGETFANYVLVNPTDGIVKLQDFTMAAEEQDTHDLRTLGNMFVNIFTAYTDTSSMYTESLRLARKLQYFTGNNTGEIWNSLRALQRSALVPAGRNNGTRLEQVELDNQSDPWSVDDSPPLSFMDLCSVRRTVGEDRAQ